MIQFHNRERFIYYSDIFKNFLNNEHIIIKKYDDSISFTLDKLKDNIISFIDLNFLQ